MYKNYKFVDFLSFNNTRTNKMRLSHVIEVSEE